MKRIFFVLSATFLLAGCQQASQPETMTPPLADQGSSSVQKASSSSRILSMKTCTNVAYGYSLRYPNDWSVWKPGAPEIRRASCDEGWSSLSFASQDSTGRIGLTVFTKENQSEAFWKRVEREGFMNETVWQVTGTGTLDGEKLMRYKYSGGSSDTPPQPEVLVAFHNEAAYEFRVYDMDSATLDTILASFTFTDNQ